MTASLRSDIRQDRAFQSLEQEAYLNLVRTAALLTDGLEQILKPAGLTTAQYNVLRILRGSEPSGLCRNEVRDRMVTRMPDMTRLLDRMEATGLVARSRGTEDRRLVSTRITAKGIRLLDKLDVAVSEEHERALGHLNRTQLKSLITLLGLAREPARR